VSELDPSVLGLAGIALTTLGIAVMLGLSLRDPNSAMRRVWRAYVGRFDAEIQYLFLEQTGAQIAAKQLVALVVTIGLLMYVRDPRVLWLVGAAFIGPNVYFYFAKRRRAKRIEQQIDSWLLMLANMLRATSSLTDAIKSTADLLRNPMRQELDLVVKELEVGRSVDDALRGMAERVKLDNLSTIVSIIVVARTTGGELPKLLESTAHSLREMARVEGVLKTKTSQAKFQVYALVAGPVLLVYALSKIDEHYFDPLLAGLIGWIVLGIAIILWATAIYLARRILSVQL
jgi:tight adherence protein B